MYRQGDRNPCIADVKRCLSVFPVSDEFDASLAERLRGIQLVFGLPVNGVLDAHTAQAAGVLPVFREPSWT